MKLSVYLSPKRVKVLAAKNKRDALDQMLALFRSSPSVADHDAFARAIWQREEVLPTGIGLGIGVPHARSDAVRHPASALAVLPEGIDYDSIDGVPVQVILLIAMPANTHHEYLLYLAKATRLFQQSAFRDTLLACQTDEELWQAVKDH